MKIIMIRHGDPDYEHDSLTEKGKREADLLVPRLAAMPVTDFYVSPLGRAKRTAQPTLERLGREAKVLNWLREFQTELDINGSEALQAAYPDTERNPDGTYKTRIVWDMLPGAWLGDERNLERNGWRDMTTARVSDMAQVYERTCVELDRLLASYGYRRKGGMYETDRGNEAVIVLFCHFGIMAAMLSHLWNVSPFILMHALAMAPSSVTEVCSEERIKGQVMFRTLRVGDISHLQAAGEEPSFACRFCEVYENMDQRH